MTGLTALGMRALGFTKAMNASTPTPVITGVTSPIRSKGAFTVTASEGFEDLQAGGFVQVEGLDVVENAWSNLSIDATMLDIETTLIPYGDPNTTILVQNNSGEFDTIDAPILPESELFDYVNMVGTMNTAGLHWEGSPAVVAGHQIVWDKRVYENDETTVVTGTPDDPEVVTNDDSSVNIINGPLADGTYKIRANRFIPGTGWTGWEWVTITFTSGPDLTAPVITLVGANPLNIEYQSVYSDPGATASDNVDGDITGNIVVGGDTVDTNTLGAYNVTYDVDDAAGNSAIQVTRTVNVVDTTAPVITLLGSTPINVDYQSVYSDAGAIATDIHDGDISGNIVVTGSVDTGTIGQYILDFDVDDAAGNSATTVQRIVNVVDLSPPIISLIGAATINVLVNTSYVDAGATATDAVDGDVTGNIVVGGDTVDVNTIGEYTITYDVDDAAGNSAIQRTRTVNVVAEISSTDKVVSNKLTSSVVTPNLIKKILD